MLIPSCLPGLGWQGCADSDSAAAGAQTMEEEKERLGVTFKPSLHLVGR